MRDGDVIEALGGVQKEGEVACGSDAPPSPSAGGRRSHARRMRGQQQGELERGHRDAYTQGNPQGKGRAWRHDQPGDGEREARQDTCRRDARLRGGRPLGEPQLPSKRPWSSTRRPKSRRPPRTGSPARSSPADTHSCAMRTRTPCTGRFTVQAAADGCDAVALRGAGVPAIAAVAAIDFSTDEVRLEGIWG
jgi:hypothetical protein